MLEIPEPTPGTTGLGTPAQDVRLTTGEIGSGTNVRDYFSLYSDAIAFGHEGNDRISVYGEDAAGYGGVGDDSIILWGPLFGGSVGSAYGEAGDDRILVRGGSEVKIVDGGEGDDHITIWPDTAGCFRGGSGDDEFILGGLGSVGFPIELSSEIPEQQLYGGEGNDDFRVRPIVSDSIYNNGEYDAVIQDFDPDEDALQISDEELKYVESIEIIENPDENYAEVIFNFKESDEFETFKLAEAITIRIAGVSNFELESIEVTSNQGGVLYNLDPSMFHIS